MAERVQINKDNLIWAIHRAGLGVQEATLTLPNLELWLKGEKLPTVKQLEAFARKMYVPFGYLFLKEPPKELLPIPFFRSNSGITDKVSINTFETVVTLNNRKEWLREYKIDNGFAPLSFVGRFDVNSGHLRIANDIRQVLGLKNLWASTHGNWTTALSHLIRRIEAAGIIVSINSLVGNNSKRKVPVEECRGFVLNDEYAPFLFVNNGDFKSAQMFTLAHELAHIWIGESAGFDFSKMLPADHPVERLCDKVAAEFLVPADDFREIWQESQSTRNVARHFKVSEIVIARRALDLSIWTKEDFFGFYNEYSNREFDVLRNRGSGGNPIASMKQRISPSLLGFVNHAINSGQILDRNAWKLVGLKGKTFKTIVNQL